MEDGQFSRQAPPPRSWLQRARGRRPGRARPITLYVPFAAGGPSDMFGRILARGLSAELGQQVVVENKGGMGGGCRCCRHRQGGARWLYDRHERHRPVGDRAVHGPQHAVRGQGSGPADADRPGADDRRDVFALAGQYRPGTDRLCQGQSRQGELRLVRSRGNQPSGGRIVQELPPASTSCMCPIAARRRRFRTCWRGRSRWSCSMFRCCCRISGPAPSSRWRRPARPARRCCQTCRPRPRSGWPRCSRTIGMGLPRRPAFPRLSSTASMRPPLRSSRPGKRPSR